MNLSVRRLLAALLLPALLASCADDESSSASSPSARASLTGSVVKGVTAHAVITITDAAGNLLATTETDAQGAYTVTLPKDFSGPVLLTATAKQGGAGEATSMRCDAPSGCVAADYSPVDFGDWFEVPLDFRMSAVINVNGWGLHMANVTPLSTLAADWAATFPQGLDPAVVSRANDAVTAMFGLAQGALEDDTSDLADPMWLQMADPQQLQMALLYAAFAEVVNGNMTGYTLQEYIAAAANHFASQGGALLQDSIDPSAPSLAALLDAAQQILLDSTTIGGVLHVPVENYGDVPATMAALRAQLNDGALTTVNEVSYDDLIVKLGPMGEQIDQLLTVSGLKDPQQFIEAQWPHFSWLTQENPLLVPLALDSLSQVAMAAVLVDLLPAGSIYEMFNDDGYQVVLDVDNKRLELSGTRYGQVVDLDIGITGLASALANGQQFNFSVQGTVTNGVASGAIDAVLHVDASGNNFQPLLNWLTSVQAMLVQNPLGSETVLANALMSLLQLLATEDTGYIYTLVADVTATGEMSLERYETPAQAVTIDFDAEAAVNMAATGNQPLLTASLLSATLGLPGDPAQVGLPGDPAQAAPNRLYGVDGKPVLTVTLAQDLEVTVDGAATGFNVPEAVLAATGGVEGARVLVDQARASLTELASNPFAFTGVIDDLLAFDFSQLHAWGEATITIAYWNHEYRATLDDLTVTLYQPHSEEVAMSAELRLAQQKIHFLLGADQEPWDLRATLTPTPGLLLVGPEGQYARLEQEDFYALLDTLQVRDILAGLVDDLFPPAP